MYRTRRWISMILLLAMMIALLPANVIAMQVTTPTQSVSSTKYFTALPGVYEMGDGYAVIWATNFKGNGYIKYKYQGVEYTVYDMKNGTIRTHDTIHVVKVPHEHLLGNTYTVYSTEVTSHQYAITNYGTTISAGPTRLKAYDGGVDDFDVLVLTDTHGKLDWSKKVAQVFAEDPDLVVFSGDIVDSLESKSTIAKMFNIMGSVTGGRYPIVYCRGNHETRGIYSTALLEYFPTETGEFYYDFRYGPLWGVVMDTGEDKNDDHEYYGKLANYKEYNEKQEAWLRSLRRDETATFRLGIYHIPRIHDLNNGLQFTDAIGHLGLQVGISGHFHTCEIYDKVTNKAQSIIHDDIVCGGYAKDVAVMMTLDHSDQKAYVTAKTSAGAIYGSFNRYPVALSNYIGPIPEPMDVPDRGLNSHFTPAGASAGKVSISVAPTVFETGGDWYNVVWMTKDDDTAEGCTGYVTYEYNGQTYQVFDEVGGYRRSHDDIHTVKVPKEHLNNNTYKVGSFLVEYAYTNPTAQSGRYYTVGDWVESEKYVFEDRSGDQAINLIACPDIKGMSTEAGRVAAAQSALAALGTSPAYVIVNGDVVSDTLNSTDDYKVLFTATAIASGSAHPVVFSRGNAECRGYYGVNLLKYIPTATGEYYYSFTAGDYTFVNFDTGEDDPDGQLIQWQGSTVKKYGDRIRHEELREKQLEWLKSLPDGKIVAISHIPFSTIKSQYGLDFESVLKDKGAVLCISGHDSQFTLKETVDSDSVYTVIPGGYNGGNTSASILLSGDYAYVKAVQSLNGVITSPAAKAVSLDNGTTVTYKATKPSSVNGSYVLSTPGHIVWLSQNCTSVNSFAGESFVLANDIDMMLVPFTPIGGNDTVSSDNNTASIAFSGTFDGCGYTIKNVNIVSANNNVGFFGVTRQATIKQLTVSGGLVNGGWYVGGLVGYSYGTKFEDCYSDLTVYSAGGSKIGGFVGFLSHGSKLNRCANFGNVSSWHSGGSTGGITGQVYSATVNEIYSSFNRGNIIAHGASGIAGGIYGYSGNVAASIRDSYNAAAVTSPGSKGAIIGSYNSSGKISVTNTYFSRGFNGATSAFKNSNSWSSASGSGTVTVLTQAALKSEAAAINLNSNDFTWVSGANSGYPVHKNMLHLPGSGGHSYQAVVTAPTCFAQGYTTYTCTCGDSYISDRVPATGHNYTTVTVEPTCTQQGSVTSTCTSCGNVVKQTTVALGHRYIWDTCQVCGYVDEGYVIPTYYLFGYINGADYACEADYLNMGIYKFVDGKLTTAFYEDSYVAVKTEGNGIWYMTDGWQGAETTSAILYNTNQLTTSDKLFIPANTYVTFTLTENPDGSLTLSYEPTECNHDYQQISRTEPTCTEDGEESYSCLTCYDSYTEVLSATGHHYIWDTCTVCGFVDETYVVPTYYLFGYINGADYACEADHLNMGIYKFVDGKLSAVFQEDSYVAVKTEGNGIWYMTDGWQGQDVTSVVLHNTLELAVADKLFVPANTHVVFTITHNPDGTLTLSYEVVTDNHSYDSVVTAPTCTDAGFTTYTCVCGHSYVSDWVSPTDHSYEGVVTAPSCTAQGFTTYTCSNCGDFYKDDIIDALGHEYNDGIVTTNPSCTEDGIRTFICEHCGDSYEELIPSEGHVYEAVVTKPSCTEDGFTVYTCSCGDTYAEVVPAMGHSYDAVVTEPTCILGGYTTYTCACGESYIGDQVPAAGHGTEIHVTEPTCNEDGIIIITCLRCAYRYSHELPSQGHCYERGICIGCGETEPVNVESPTINLVSPNLLLEDSIKLNVFFDVDREIPEEKMGMLTWREQPEVVDISTADDIIPGATFDVDMGLYGATTKPIPAQNLGDVIYFCIYVELSDGTYAYSRQVHYSPTTYAYNQLKSSDTTASAKSLYVSILNYGAAAQEYLNYKVDTLVNADLSEEMRSLVEAYHDDMVHAVIKPDAIKQGTLAANGGFDTRRPSIALDGAFSIYYYFKPSAEVSGEMTFYYWNDADFATVDVLSTDNATGSSIMIAEDGVYSASISGIAAKDIDSALYACGVYTDVNGNTYSTGVLPYSLGSYCGNQAASTPLAAAIAVYGYYAVRYFSEY